ncbi:MAG: SpvB/TcaC N-terminal domain-containing protein, partial [Flavipsychrobacter sp.]
MNNNQNNLQSNGKGSQRAYPLDSYSVSPGQNTEKENVPYYKSSAPSISLPKGGGALKGIDEKFSVNAVNGTAALQVSLPITPGRGGFTPNLSLSYNSGGGNTEFGLGWGLGLPSISRRTDKRLPSYNDADESDVFLFAGAEDLVPKLDGSGNAVITTYTTGGNTYHAKQYIPRIEGLFARIEHITKDGSTVSWWRVTGKDNTVTYYGLTASGRIADPSNNSRIFKWLPQLGIDRKGNVQEYSYISENTSNVVFAAHEHNRLNNTALFTNTYLKSVKYCNTTPFTIASAAIYEPSFPVSPGYLMEVVFDYGDHSTTINTSVTPNTYTIPHTPDTIWPVRKDPFSDFHAGFEIRSYRRCRRVLMFHYFNELNAGNAVLVHSLDMVYQQDTNMTDTYTEADFITSFTSNGYTRTTGEIYTKKSLPAFTCNYQPLSWSSNLQNVSAADAENAPQGLTGPCQWIDLYGEGLPGILSEYSGGWYYKNNMGNGHFTPAQRIASKPSYAGLGSALQWSDLQADGRRQLVSRDTSNPGYFELDDDQNWQSFTAFKEWVNVDWNSPYTRILDLNGDGRPDILLTEERAWRWYENEGTDGYALGGEVSTTLDEEQGPRILLNDMMQVIFLADMNGDGMTDIVRIQNGEVSYWPNMGYGSFGAKVMMTNAPVFDLPDQFNPVYITLADISGTGAADIIYLGKNKCTAWINLAGNAFSNPTIINPLPGTEQYSKIGVMDFLGSGTACIVWSSPLPQHAWAPMRYIDLMGGNKPYLLTGYSNGMGKSTTLTYRHSTQYYLDDKQAGTPWATRLPFPVHCIQQVATSDSVSETIYIQSYTYHHGYYDHEEREFRGFGRVDTIDTDAAKYFNSGTSTENDLDQAPVLTKTWYHTGAWMRESNLIDQFELEYYNNSAWNLAGLASYPAGL